MNDSIRPNTNNGNTYVRTPRPRRPPCILTTSSQRSAGVKAPTNVGTKKKPATTGRVSTSVAAPGRQTIPGASLQPPEVPTVCILQDRDLSGNPGNSISAVDLREQLVNEGTIGKITDVSLSAVRIAQLNGILFDLDPHLFRVGSLLPAVPTDVHEFYATLVRPWLDRHPVLAHAQVRNSGTGIHVILWLEKPVVFDTDEDRNRWTGIVKVVQAALPIDPNMPHISALTRPVGSINSKNNAQVSTLQQGHAVPIAGILSLYEEMKTSPFKTVMSVLTGSDKIEPCPVCGKRGSRLAALDFVGRCYASCGNVKLAQLYDSVFAPRTSECKEVSHDDAGHQ